MWGGTPWQITGTRTFSRWHEAPRDVFRFIGKAADIIRLRHNGWYLDGDCPDETTEGLVFMLPHNRFLAAGSDPNNEGSAYFEVDARGNPEIYSDKEDAARGADRLAELYAEAEREHQLAAREELRAQEEREEADSLTEAFSFAC